MKVFSEYIHHAMALAEYHELEDHSFAGNIPPCKGVLAFAPERGQCELRLQAVLENWILLRLSLGQALPVIHGIDLNREPAYE